MKMVKKYEIGVREIDDKKKWPPGWMAIQTVLMNDTEDTYLNQFGTIGKKVGGILYVF